MPNIAPPPLRSDVSERGGRITRQWADWLQQSLVPRAEDSTTVRNQEVLTAQTAAIGTTPLPTGALAAGTYRISWYARITTPASVNSSLTVTISWTDGTVTQSYSGAAVTGNTTTTNQSDSRVIDVDASSAISYATAYASNAAGMAYKLTLTLEALL